MGWNFLWIEIWSFISRSLAFSTSWRIFFFLRGLVFVWKEKQAVISQVTQHFRIILFPSRTKIAPWWIYCPNLCPIWRSRFDRHVYAGVPCAHSWHCKQASKQAFSFQWPRTQCVAMVTTVSSHPHPHPPPVQNIPTEMAFMFLRVALGGTKPHFIHHNLNLNIDYEPYERNMLFRFYEHKYCSLSILRPDDAHQSVNVHNLALFYGKSEE